MHVAVLVALAGVSGAAAQKVLQLDISKPRLNFAQRQKMRLARRDTINEPLINGQYLYAANVSVGTPPQQLQMQLDTGSSDVWMTASTASFCQQSPYNCVGGTFDESRSSTFNVVDQGGFEISYVDQTGSSGDFFTDVIQVGPDGSQTSVDDQQMGLATQTTIGTGIIGVGFAADESVCDSGSPESCQTYPTLVQNMVSQGKINSQAYSLWLNDLSASTGSILFGGIDTKKFMGELVTLPIQPDADTGAVTSFTVAWTGFSLGTPSGSKGGFVPDTFAQPAILDSGTTLMLVPDELADAIYQQFDATYYSEAEVYLASCNLRSSTATFDFQFGGPQGALIRVPIDELLLDAGTDAYGQRLTLRNGDDACEIGVEAASGRPILFGDTFLRSAYVVYDLDNKLVSLAQTDFNSTESNVQEIQAGRNGLPDTSTTATAVSVRQSATGLPGLGGLGSNVPKSSTASPTPSTSSDGGDDDNNSNNDGGNEDGPDETASGAPLAQYTATNTNSPQPNGAQPAPGSSSTAAAARRATVGPIFSVMADSLCMSAAVGTFMALGTALVLL